MINKIKILFVETGRPSSMNNFGGSVYSIIQLIQSLDKIKYKTFYYSKYHTPKAYKILEDIGVTVLSNKDNSKIKKKTIKNYFPNILKKNILYEYLSFKRNRGDILKYSNIINKHNIDIVHGNDRFIANINVLIASKANSVIYVQHQRKYENKIPFYLKKYVNYPTKYLAISKSIKNNVLELLKINTTKILLLHNWINTNHNRININKKNLENYDLNILWFGRILPWKGIDTIVELGKILKKNKLTFKFHIYGDFYNGHYEEKICNKIKLLGFEKLYKFYGNKSQSEIFSKKYDLFLHTSIKPEPFGRTIIESMYNEIPVIATNMGGVRDIIIDNYNGFVYNINNYEKIISSIKYLMTDNQKEEIILNAKKTIFQKFSEKSQSQIINKFYNEISDEKKN